MWGFSKVNWAWTYWKSWSSQSSWKSLILFTFCVFRVQNSSKWPQKWCPVLGEQIREILGVDVSTKQTRFLGKSQVFANKIFIFLKNMMKKQLNLSPQKTVWFEQKLHVKLKISRPNQKHKILSIFIFHDKLLKSYTFSKKFISFLKKQKLEKMGKLRET